MACSGIALPFTVVGYVIVLVLRFKPYTLHYCCLFSLPNVPAHYSNPNEFILPPQKAWLISCTPQPPSFELGTTRILVAACVSVLKLRLHEKGAGVAQSVQCLTTDWTTWRSVFDPRQKQNRFFPLASCVQTGSGAYPASCPMGTGGLFPGVKRGRGVTLTAHPHLVPRSRMSRSYTLSATKRLPGVEWDCFTFYMRKVERQFRWAGYLLQVTCHV
jgi:hypothetical protein